MRNSALWLLVLLFVACAAHDSIFDAPRTDPAALFTSGAGDGAVSVAVATAHGASASVRHPATHCDVSGGLPVVLALSQPLAGRPFVASWYLRPSSPPAPVYQMCLLLVSLRDGIANPIDGAPGCVWQVHPDYIMAPQAGSVLTQSAGVVSLDWTPAPSLVGVVFRTQLVVEDPRNLRGFVVSPALEIAIGNM